MQILAYGMTDGKHKTGLSLGITNAMNHQPLIQQH